MKKILSVVAALLLLGGAVQPASAYPSGTGEVGQLWGVVIGTQSKIQITARGVSESDVSAIRVSVTNPRGFGRVIGNVVPDSDGNFRFTIGGLRWIPGTYQVTIRNGDRVQTLGVFVSSKRVRG